MNKKVYVMCGGHNLYEGMTKEDIIAAIAEATGNTPTLVGDAFVSQVVNQNNGGNLKLWRGTRSEYNAVNPKDDDTYYIITDDANPDDTFSVYAHSKSGKIHELTCTGGGKNIKFVASDAFAEGDSFKVNGSLVNAQTPDGQLLPDGFFVQGAVVCCFLNGDTVNFKGGGGKKLPALTNPATAAQIFKGYQGINAAGEAITGTALGTAISAAISQVTNGKTFYNEKGELKTGTMIPYYFQTYTQTCTKKSNVTVAYTGTGGTLDLVIAYMYDRSRDSNIGDTAMVINGAVLESSIGFSPTENTFSISGNTVNIFIGKQEVIDWDEGDLYLKTFIVSH